jgi:hypothetical protein
MTTCEALTSGAAFALDAHCPFSDVQMFRISIGNFSRVSRMKGSRDQSAMGAPARHGRADRFFAKTQGEGAI